MKFLGPTRHPRLNEAGAFVFLLAGLFIFLSLASYYAFDPSWNTASSVLRPVNLTGLVGSYLSDFLLQTLGWAAYTVPVLLFLLGLKWIWSSEIHTPWVRVGGALLWVTSTGAALGMIPGWRPFGGAIPAGGLVGVVLADFLIANLNPVGAVIVTLCCWIVSLYLVSTFEVARLKGWLEGPVAMVQRISASLASWREQRALRAKEKAEQRALRRAMKRQEQAEGSAAQPWSPDPIAEEPAKKTRKPKDSTPPIVDPLAPVTSPPPITPLPLADIPILALEDRQPADSTPPWEGTQQWTEPELVKEPSDAPMRKVTQPGQPPRKQRTIFRLPPSTLLQEPPARSAYDSQELKDIAARIKSKFEEFNVHGSVTQINPGPVVTTFEYKPEAGVKYSRITTLTEDLCLGLQAESILIERIPGKPTVGIEVPNSKREVISLRQILESDEFDTSASPLTVALGKDISGRIKVAALDSMPHLLIAGSTGSGKSVMLNSLIMSILYKATPHQVRMIMVDPKRLEFGLYEGIPHLLTPVITDAKKATYALRNAVLEMERRLKLLAALGVRNIEQYNKKVKQLEAKPRSLFEEEPEEEPLEQIPYILILIDELADLMMLERAAVEESVTRLAQMARAVGMHLVLATQRPSVDVITGLIKANFPSRISFRVATRVDSRTVLDVMGAEHLLGKGDMLFLPPGSSRLVRVHGSYVSEAETNDVVEFWKEQAQPDYDKSFLIAPVIDDEDAEGEDLEGPEDPMYQEAVRVVCELGKASTSTLQRRLRLGYGRAARILDMMQRDGIIGPPDGSRPREVLKRPDWLAEVENQLP
jgi:S-DNA-T family DNA segregation ATPase FtsK/SpoIIIE